MATRAKLLPRLTVALLSTVLALAAFEIGHRLWFYGPEGLSPRVLASVRSLGESGLVQDAAEASVEYELRPNLDAWFKLEPFATNSHGQRDREYAIEKPPGTFRIVVVGDSFTMGSGVAIEDVFHSRLESSLGPGFECINLGVGGYGLLHYAAVLEHVVPRWDPDLVLIGLVANDSIPPEVGYLRTLVEGSPRRTTRPPGEPRSFLRLTCLDRLLEEDTLTDRWGDLDEDALHAITERDAPGERPERLVLALEVALDGLREAKPVETYIDAAFFRLGELARSAGTPVFCIYMTTRHDPRRAAIWERVATEEGFGFLSTTPLFVDSRPREHWILPNDPHPDAVAHGRYAELLEEALVDGGWLDR